jgi:glycosyltransferase involved in cell wall biosynthesis
VVVSVGRLDPEKDPLTLVRAVARVPRPDLHLVLVGDGSLREAVEEEGARAGLGGRLVVTGFRPRREIPSFLHLAHCFVMASRYEGFPFALAEALAAGVPVVASDARQIDELLTGTGASRFPAGDAEALAGRIAEVLADPARARAAAARGRERVAAFDQEAIDALEAELYREVLRREGDRG